MTHPYLPTELIELISTYLDLPTFRSMRLTSQELSKQTLHHLRTHYLSTQHLSWTRSSLDVFLARNTHPTLSGALIHLVVDATPHHAQTLWRASKTIAEKQAASPWPHTGGAELNGQLNAARTASTAANTFFNETRWDIKVLMTVFASLGKLESLVFEYAGLEMKYAKFGNRYCACSQHEMSRPFVSTMAAVAATGLRVGGIHVGDSNYGAVGIGRLESLAPVLGKFDEAFAKLTSLELRLRDWRCPDEGFALDDNARAPFVVRFLAKAAQLKELKLDCHTNFEDDVFGHMARHCVFPQLKRCKLTTLPINVHNPRDLHTFLLPCTETLEFLHLQSVLLPGGGEEASWPELLEDLASDETVLKTLKELMLHNLFAAKGNRIWFRGAPLGSLLGEHDEVGLWRRDILDRDIIPSSSGSRDMWEGLVGAYPWVGFI